MESKEEVSEVAEELFQRFKKATEEERHTWTIMAEYVIQRGYSRTQNGNGNKLSKEEFTKELFNSLGGCIIKETTGETIYDKWLATPSVKAMRFPEKKEQKQQGDSTANWLIELRAYYEIEGWNAAIEQCKEMNKKEK